MNEIPWRCSTCGHEQMVDLECLSRRPIDKIVTARGFVCGKCSSWEAISYSNSSLEEIMRKLKRYSPEQPQYQRLLAKAIRKAEALQTRGECNGASKHSHMAPVGPMG